MPVLAILEGGEKPFKPRKTNDPNKNGGNVSNIIVNKGDVIELISQQAEISKASATRALNAFLEAVSSALCSGKSVNVLGFGTFAVKARSARVGRNPKTGEPIDIKAANVPVFKAGKALKDAVNSASDMVKEKID